MPLSLLGARPRIGDDAFTLLSQRRAQIADLIAMANLDAYEQEVASGLYLAIPFFPRCSDKQPVWLVNRTAKPFTYLSRPRGPGVPFVHGVSALHS